MGFGIHRVAGEAAAKRGPLRPGKWTKQSRGRQQMLQLIGDRGVCEASQAISDELSKLRRGTSLNKSCLRYIPPTGARQANIAVAQFANPENPHCVSMAILGRARLTNPLKGKTHHFSLGSAIGNKFVI
jgi:hypothetical protein